MMIFFANMCSKVSFGRNKSTNTSDFENHTLKTHIEGSAIANSDSSPLAKFNMCVCVYVYVFIQIKIIIQDAFKCINMCTHVYILCFNTSPLAR